MNCYDHKIIKRIWLTLFTIATTTQLVACDSSKVCPVYCICKLKDNLNHADCSGKRLISPYSAVPQEVQSLDLSYNDITVLDNDCFKGYIHLINITISNNAIHTILLETFVPLKRIHSIDLSYNRLEYIDPRLFESNRKLQTLNLAGNKFTYLSNEPFLRSRYLRAINLAHAQINVFLPQHYKALPLLHEIDLSHNLIITIDKFAAKAPKLLRTLNLAGNNLNCDQSLQSAIKQLEDRNVDVKYYDCQVTNTVRNDMKEMEKQFERLQLVDEQTHMENEENGNEDLGDSQEHFNETVRNGVLTGWHLPISAEYSEDYYIDFDVDEVEENEGSIASFNPKSLNETCRLWCLKLLPTNTFNNPANVAGKQYTDFDLLFVFICGNAVGLALTIFLGSCILCIWRCSAALKPSSIRIENPCDSHYAIVPQAHASVSRTTVDTIRAPSFQNPASAHEHITISSPQPPRRRQRHTQSTQRTLIRHNQLGHSGGDNFISRLFGRPARHQYYRTINENTAHLIRRLSRSNLFNNRLNQHFERERSTISSPPNTPDDPDDAVHEPNAGNELEDVVAATRTPHRRRPETPPPLYSEIVSKRDNQNS
ncbi:uncharacterized protein [Eurosta solidaginis]|uniref:uncharacterized protein n=1 Tax=Eurosta solidaginis TaxID=178769 RepID=UPI0035312862